MSALLLVQMSGAPGAGKSTVVRAIGRRKGTVVLDHDVTKSALLEAELEARVAGRASYLTLRALASLSILRSLCWMYIPAPGHFLNDR